MPHIFMNYFCGTPSLESAYKLLDEFSKITDQYSANRNFDIGSPHPHVSKLSPFISHRAISEKEIVERIQKDHSYPQYQKFIQEVYWRTYWKGWLEMRPEVWADYFTFLTNTPPKSDNKGYQQAISSQTGIACFDHWMKELQETAYLHNHARMWFASIWIFTLKLPWQWGASLFHHHLLDGDAASNTLSWRWVAGLQTKGKAYFASADNINTFTKGRFNPANQLTENTLPLEEKKIYCPASIKFPTPSTSKNDHPVLLFSDHLEKNLLKSSALSSSALVLSSIFHEENSRSAHYKQFEKLLSENFISCHPELAISLIDSQDSLIDWLGKFARGHINIPYLTVGLTKDGWQKFIKNQQIDPMRFVQVSNPWDKKYWPYAKKGYFAFKKAIGL